MLQSSTKVTTIVFAWDGAQMFMGCSFMLAPNGAFTCYDLGDWQISHGNIPKWRIHCGNTLYFQGPKRHQKGVGRLNQWIFFYIVFVVNVVCQLEVRTHELLQDIAKLGVKPTTLYFHFNCWNNYNFQSPQYEMHSVTILTQFIRSYTIPLRESSENTWLWPHFRAPCPIDNSLTL